MKRLSRRMSKDANGHVIQAAGGFSTIDGTATPYQSPQALTTSELELIAPAGAVAVILHSDDIVYIDSKTGVDIDNGIDLIADVFLQLPIAEGESIFIAADVTANLYFTFLNILE